MATTDKQTEESTPTIQFNGSDRLQAQNKNLLRTTESDKAELVYVSEGRVDIIRADSE